MSKDSNYDKQESNNRKKVSYLYVLSSPNEGEFTISEAKAMVDGKMIKSTPLNIKIIK